MNVFMPPNFIYLFQSRWTSIFILCWDCVRQGKSIREMEGNPCMSTCITLENSKSRQLSFWNRAVLVFSQPKILDQINKMGSNWAGDVQNHCCAHESAFSHRTPKIVPKYLSWSKQLPLVGANLQLALNEFESQGLNSELVICAVSPQVIVLTTQQPKHTKKLTVMANGQMQWSSTLANLGLFGNF